MIFDQKSLGNQEDTRSFPNQRVRVVCCFVAQKRSMSLLTSKFGLDEEKRVCAVWT